MQKRVVSLLIIALIVLTGVFSAQAQDPRGNAAASVVGDGPAISGDPLITAGCAGVFQNDDGTIENGYGFNPGFGINDLGHFAEPYTLPSTPYTMTQACVCFTRNGGDADLSMDVVLFDDNAGQPGTELARHSFTLVGVPTWPSTAFYDLPLGDVVNTTDIWVAVNWNVDVELGFYVCADENGPSPSLGLVTIDAGALWEAPTFYWPGYKAFGIRADGDPVGGGDLEAVAYCGDGANLIVEVFSADFPVGIGDDNNDWGFLNAAGTFELVAPESPYTYEGLALTEFGGDLEQLEMGNYSCPGVNYPNKGEIMISAGAPVMTYGAAGDYPTGIVLPADYDGNGYDTYIVTKTATVGDATWYAIWVGGPTYLWVPASQVQTLR